MQALFQLSYTPVFYQDGFLAVFNYKLNASGLLIPSYDLVDLGGT